MFMSSADIPKVTTAVNSIRSRYAGQRLRAVFESAIKVLPISLRRAVTDGSVTAGAIRRAAGLGRAETQHRIGQIAVTIDARTLQDSCVLRPDDQGVMEILKGERLGVPKAVLRLRQILADEVVRRVATVAGGDGVMA